MANPFPIPRNLSCPYCGEIGVYQYFNDSSYLAFYNHHVRETKKVGHLICITLHTIHPFVAKWDGNEWRTKKQCPGSHQMCERVELGNGKSSDWNGYDIK